MSAPVRNRPPVIWLTCLDRRDHAVRDEEFAGNPSGVFQAVCGGNVVPASSHCAPRPPCGSCGNFVLAWTRARTRPHPHLAHRRCRHARPSWWSRLWGQR